MTLNPWLPHRPIVPAPVPGELITDYRARLAHERMQAIERRELQVAEQTSALNAPQARIRAWERLHEVDLPRSPAHRLVAIIAGATALSVEQVQDEQRQRATPLTPVSAAQALFNDAPTDLLNKP
jgi:hypothetical protein